MTYAGFNDPELEPILSEQLEALIAQRAPEPAPPVSDTGDTAEGDLTYDGLIGEMLTTACAACHGSSATAGLDVNSYQSLLDGGNSGPGVVAGEPESSLVYARQTEASAHYFQLDEGQLKQLMDWILAGAPEN